MLISLPMIFFPLSISFICFKRILVPPTPSVINMAEKHVFYLLPVGKDGIAINKSILPGGEIFILYFTEKVNWFSVSFQWFVRIVAYFSLINEGIEF